VSIYAQKRITALVVKKLANIFSHQFETELTFFQRQQAARLPTLDGAKKSKVTQKSSTGSSRNTFCSEEINR
jgi:hypothetical protein